MIHHLTPQFILTNADQNRHYGQFPGVALFADVSGFTQLTSALMTHGNEGAETIAALLSAVFDPLVEIVYAHGGFIAGFAGDAFKAIFPIEERKSSYTEGRRDSLMTEDAHHRAVDAAWRICVHMRNHHTHETRFGTFDFDVTLCVADGDVTWEILSDQRRDEDKNPDGQQMACLIEGSALAQCLALDPFAQTGHVLLSSALAARLDPARVQTKDLDYGARLITIEPPQVDEVIDGVDLQDNEHDLAAQARRFHPASLLDLKTQGEFRRVITLFFDLQTLPAPDQRRRFEREFFQLLRQYDGYLCRVGRAGDWGSAATFLLFWGAPTSHENDNQRALDFALNLLAACPTPARAGITTNIAYAGFVGGARHEEYTCYGNYVNLAARQTKAAKWGEIWLDRETARQATGAFTIESLGTREFKGFEKPRPVFQLHARAADASEHFYQHDLIGRDAELAQLRRACQPIFEGRFGGTVTVVGEAGMGKSRLVHEFQQQLIAEAATSGQAVRWFLCQTDEILRQPLNPIRYFLRHYFEQTDEADEAERKRHFESRLDKLIALTVDETLRAELQRVHSFLGALVDLHWADSLYEQLDPELRFENTIEALKSFIKAESLRQPLILQVEDIHWIDQETLTSLARLMRNVADYPFVVVATARPSATGTLDTRLVEAVPEEAPTTVVKLNALANDQLEAMAADLLDGPPAPSLSTLLEERADGNPFFVEHILLYLREQNLLTETDDGWAMGADDNVDKAARQAVLSGDVRAVLTARLDRLDSPVREVVQTASVLGREFDERVLAHMMQQDQRLPDKLATASQAAIWSAIEQTRYMFRHALLRDAAYDMQLRTTLRSLHARAGAAIETIHEENLSPYYADLVHHYNRSEERSSEGKFAELAGEYAAEQYANNDAIRFLQRAIALTPEERMERAATTSLALAKVYDLLGRRDELKHLIQSLLEYANSGELDADTHAEILRMRAKSARVTGEFREAIVYARAAAEITNISDSVRAIIYHTWGRTLVQLDEHQEASDRLQTAFDHAQSADDQYAMAQSLYDLGLIDYSRSRLESAQRYFDSAHNYYLETNYQEGRIMSLLMTGGISEEQGDFDTAMSKYELSLTRSRQIGWKHGEIFCLGYLGNLYYEFGSYDEAARYHNLAFDLCRQVADIEGEAISLDTLGLILMNQGEEEEGKRHFAAAAHIQRQIGDTRSLAYTLTHLGAALTSSGDYERARIVLEEAEQIRCKRDDQAARMDTLGELAQIAYLVGDLEHALEMVQAITAWTAEHGVSGIEYPANLHLICQRILRARSDGDDHFARQADSILHQGRSLIHARASTIQNEELRQSFLNNVAFNLELEKLWEAHNRGMSTNS